MQNAEQIALIAARHLGPSWPPEMGRALTGRLAELDLEFPQAAVDQLGRGLAERIEGNGRQLVGLHVQDIIIALACLAGDTEALRALEQVAVPLAIEGLRPRLASGEAAEIAQQLRVHLLVAAPGAQPKLALYAGRGPLHAFARVVALNLMLKAQAVRAGEGGEGLQQARRESVEFESQFLAVDQQVHFREAFRGALKKLTSRQRMLLKLNMLEGLSIDALAPMYGAHRSSIARWLGEAKEELASKTRVELAQHLKLDTSSVERLIASVQHHFELSLSQVLGEVTPPPEG